MFGLFVSLFILATQETVKLIPIYERTFDDTIVDAIFDTATMAKEEAVKIGWKKEIFEDKKLMRRFLTQAKGKLRLMYPKVIFIGKMPRYVNCRKKWNIREIRFYNKMGVLIKRVKNVKGFITYSTNGKYILISHPYDDYNPEGYGGILYDWNGNIIWQKDKGCFECVSDNGYTADYWFTIYNPKGEKIKSIKLPDWKIWDAGIFSTANYFVVAYRGKAGFDSTGIMLITEKGEIVFDTRVPGDVTVSGHSVFILPGDKVITASCGFEGRKAIILNFNGKIERIIPLNTRLSHVVYQIVKNEAFVYSSAYGDLFEIDIKSKKVQKHLKIGINFKIHRNILWKIRENKICGFERRAK